jgi:hypothetical protein
MLVRFPLLALSLAFFSVVGWTSPEGRRPWYEVDVLQIRLMSGDNWHVSGGHLFLVFSMVLLFIEIVRATSSGFGALINHALSMLVFVFALIMFLTSPGYGNSIFFIYVSMTALDVMAGIIITVVASRRDVTLQHFAQRH